MLEESAAARHGEQRPFHRVGGEVIVHGDVEVVDDGHFLESRDGVSLRTHLDFQIVAEGNLRPRGHPVVPAAENGVVVVLFPVFAAGLVAAADTEAEGQTEGIAGDKELREYDEFCAVIGTLVNVAQDFFDAAVLIKHDGCGLNDGNFAGVGKISHKITSIKP